MLVSELKQNAHVILFLKGPAIAGYFISISRKQRGKNKVWRRSKRTITEKNEKKGKSKKGPGLGKQAACPNSTT